MGIKQVGSKSRGPNYIVLAQPNTGVVMYGVWAESLTLVSSKDGTVGSSQPTNTEPVDIKDPTRAFADKKKVYLLTSFLIICDRYACAFYFKFNHI